MTDKKRFSPFSNGSEYMSWEARNCDKCTKATWEGEFNCELQKAIGYGAVSDGTIPMEIAKRIGIIKKPYKHLGMCKELNTIAKCTECSVPTTVDKASSCKKCYELSCSVTCELKHSCR